MPYTRGKTIAEKYADQEEKRKNSAKQRKPARILTNAEKKRVEQLQKWA